MSSFTSPIEFSRVSGGLILTKPLTFYYNDDLTGSYITIPEGHFFNGASIPKVFQKAFGFDPFNPYWLAASIVHDALIGEFCDPVPILPENKILNWNDSADWFNKALKVTQGIYGNCPKLYRKLFVSSVKIYGMFR